MLSKNELLDIKEKFPRNFTQKIKAYNKDTYDLILQYCIDNNIKTESFSQALFHFITDLKSYPVCKTCGTIINKFGGNYLWGYPSFCSNKCVANDVFIKEKKTKARNETLNKNPFKDRYLNEIENLQNNTSLRIYDFELLHNKFMAKYKQIDLANVERILLKKDPNFIKSLMYYYDYSLKFNELLYLVEHKLEEPIKCKICGNKAVFHGNNGYSNSCSLSCSTLYNLRIQRRNKFDNLVKFYKDLGYEILTNIDVFEMDGSRIECKCPKGHYRSITLSNIYKYTGCKLCLDGIGISKFENEIEDFLLTNNIEIKRNSRKIIPPKELDIYIPEYNIGIEFNGLYWHSELKGTPKKYHLEKTLDCENKSIQLIHIFENEWIDKQEIIKSILLSKLGKYKYKYQARKCYVKEIDNKLKNEFLLVNHLQGKDTSSIRLGLFDKVTDELLSVMTFGIRKITGSSSKLELIRFANKLNSTVIGGASKLLKYFELNYKPEHIVTYADRRFSNGNFYQTLEFTLKHISQPNYWYIKNGIVFNRINFQKHKLINILENYDSSLTEWENMQNAGYTRIWDCGNYVFEKFVKI